MSERKEKFTPGPWRTGQTDMQSYDGAGEPISSVYCDDARAGRHLGRQLPLRVATVHGVNLKREEEKANAYLIAAAPELYEVVTRFEDYLHGRFDLCDGRAFDDETERLAKAALAKARGES